MAALTIGLTKNLLWTPNKLEQTKTALMGLMHRIQSIELLLGHDTPKLFSLLSQPAPLMEKVLLSDGIYKANRGEDILLPLDSLSDAPRLRSIRFERLCFSWQSVMLRHRTVTELRLGGGFGTMDDASTVGQMIDALHHLPNLRVLNLNNSIPSHTTSHGDEKTLEFKFLERLELGATAMDCIFFLRHIQYPSHTLIRLTSFVTSVEESATIFSLVGRNRYHTGSAGTGIPHSSVKIQSAQLIYVEGWTVEIIFFDRPGMEHLESPLRGPTPVIHLSLASGPNSTFFRARAQLLMSVPKFFDLSSLKGLLLDCDFTQNHIPMIQNSFGKLPSLEVISVSRSLQKICLAIAGSFEEATRPENPAQNPAVTMQIPPVTIFPALKILVVRSVSFQQDQNQLVECLVHMLMKRSDFGVPIDGLSLEQCFGLGTQQKRRLGELVVDLDVDGEVIDVKELNSDDDRSDEESYSEEDESGEESHSEEDEGDEENYTDEA